MLRNSLLGKATLFIALTTVVIFGCKKRDSNPLPDADDNGGYASDASHVEWLCNDAISIADAAGNFYNGQYMRVTNTFGECATVATDSTISPRKHIIRFGNSNCKCLDGRYRRGTITVTFDSTYNKNKQMHTITFDNYYVNDVQLSGSIVTTRVDTTVVGNWYYAVKSDVAMTTKPNEIVRWQSSMLRKWIAGYATGEREDNMYSISGSASLTRANGHLFTFNINTPIQFAQNCDYAESGVITVSGYDGPRTLNYGAGTDNPAGTCDDGAQLNIGVHVYQIKL